MTVGNRVHAELLAETIHTGDVSSEHVQQVVRLADQVGTVAVAQAEPTLVEAAPVLDLSQFTLLTDRIRAHVDPDGADPAAGFDRRGFGVIPVGGMASLRGQLAPEGGAALMTALDAVMTPPDDADTRTASQRRANALVELARRQLDLGDLPTVGGQRPQVGVLVYPQALSPQTLATLAGMQRDSFATQRLRQFLTDTDTDTDTGDETDPTADGPKPDGAATSSPGRW